AVGKSRDQIHFGLLGLGVPETWSDALVANSAWRFLMLLGALPALLTFLIRIFVPESDRWQRERVKGSTTHWATRDLLAVCVGSFGACAIIYLWVNEYSLGVQAVATAVALVLVTVGYPYPVIRYLQRSQGGDGSPAAWLPTVRRMALGAALSGVPLLVTWASIHGWLPLYLPELFTTRVRATGQGFSYNFGRILAAVGVLQTGNLTGLFGGDYARACAIMSLFYLVGVAVVWLGPETRGQPLPE